MRIGNIRKGCAEEVRIKLSPEGWTGVTQDERKGMNNLDRGNNDCKDSKTVDDGPPNEQQISI